MTTTLDTCEAFFNEVALPSFAETFPEICPRMGAGLVGNGSECFGYDDELSQDHDWGIDFLIWLTEEDYALAADEVREWKRRLMEDNPHLSFRTPGEYGVAETVVTPGRFFKALIGFPEGPRTLQDWRRIPETNLFLATDGRLFRDPVGDMTRIREQLLAYYPEDLRLKKTAARCMAIAQTGQYNFLRCAQRKDTVAKEVTLARFVENTISLVFLLNKRFKPYYKWAFRALRELPVLGQDVAVLLEKLYTDERGEGELDSGNVVLRPIDEQDRSRAIHIERICGLLIGELHAQGLSHAESTFMAHHGERVQQLIEDPFLASLPAQYE